MLNTNAKNFLIVQVVMKFFGKEFSLLMDKQKINIDVVFISIILYVDKDKRAILDLCKSFFKNHILEEIYLVLDNIDENLCILK